MNILIGLLALLMLITTTTAHADLVDDLGDLIGYTIVASKTIVGWYDDNEKDERSFKGCKHGRVIVFSDNKILTCAEYGYQYAYRPTAIILAKEISYQGQSFNDFKMIVGDKIYDMRR